MTDCPNGEVRDLLPDLLAGRLDSSTHAMVQGHVDGCADCSSELALLRDLRATMHRAPAIDTGSVVAAIPAYRAPVRRSWAGWRTAAAVTLIVGGASSALLIRNGETNVRDSASVEMPSEVVPPAVTATAPVASAPSMPAAVVTAPSQQTPSAPAATSAVTVTPASAPAAKASGRELAVGGGALHDLSDNELASLLKDIDKFDALPSTDVDAPDTAPINPNARRSSP